MNNISESDKNKMILTSNDRRKLKEKRRRTARGRGGGEGGMRGVEKGRVFMNCKIKLMDG